jgi:hypothetical protein
VKRGEEAGPVNADSKSAFSSHRSVAHIEHHPSRGLAKSAINSRTFAANAIGKA